MSVVQASQLKSIFFSLPCSNDGDTFLDTHIVYMPEASRNVLYYWDKQFFTFLYACSVVWTLKQLSQWHLVKNQPTTQDMEKRWKVDLMVWKIPRVENGNLFPVFLLHRKFHWQRSLIGYSPWGCSESKIWLNRCTLTHTSWNRAAQATYTQDDGAQKIRTLRHTWVISRDCYLRPQ